MSTSSPERVFEVEMNNFPPPPAVNVKSNNPPPQQLVFDIVGVEEGRINSNLETAMNTIAISTRPENTTKAYAKKQKEWHLFCDHAYPYDDAKFCYTVNEERCYRFILFQCFRSRRKRGGRNGGNNSAPVFDSEEYDEVIRKYGSGGHIPLEAVLDGISNSTLAQYRAVVKEEHDMQASRGGNTFSWDLIWTAKCKKLQKMVKTCGPMQKKASYAKKISHQFSPFQILNKFGEIEKQLWNLGNENFRCAVAHLRNRYAMLHTTGAIMRFESLERAVLSDFFHIKFKREDDVDKSLILVNSITTGKS